MPKRISITLLFTVVIALVALFVATEVTATGGSSPPNAVCNDFTIELIRVTPGAGTDPDEYEYSIVSNLSSYWTLQRLEFAVQAGLEVSGDGVTQQDPGDGGAHYPYYGVNFPDASVVTVELPGDSLVLFVKGAGGSEGSVGAATNAVKSWWRKRNETCVVQGPVKGLPSYVSVPDQRIEVSGVEYCIPIESRTGCPPEGLEKIYPCAGGDPIFIDPNFVLGTPDGGPASPTSLLFVQAPGQNPVCPIALLGHNPCTWISLGGTPYGPICW